MVKLRGRNISDVAPSNGEVLKWNSTSSEWEPSADNNSGGSGGGNLTTKGDLEVYTDTQTRLPVSSTNGHVLTVDSSEASGLKWAEAAGGIDVSGQSDLDHLEYDAQTSAWIPDTFGFRHTLGGDGNAENLRISQYKQYIVGDGLSLENGSAVTIDSGGELITINTAGGTHTETSGVDIKEVWLYAA